MASCREFARFAGIGPVLVDYKLPTAGTPIPHPLPGLRADLGRMLDNCMTDEQRTLVALCGLEGLRVGEALDAKTEDFDFRERTIHVWGKGAAERTIPFTDEARAYILPQYLQTHIDRPRGALVTYSDRGARNFITTLAVAAGISRPVSSHDLRATFATMAYAQTLNQKAVQAWLGHKSGDTTQVYIDVPLEMMRTIGNFGGSVASSS